MQLTPGIEEQIGRAYRRMAEFYRPAAPSDGFGNLAVPQEELDLDAEAREYTQRWWEEENNGNYWIGSCNHATRPATIYAVEAARLMCGVADNEVVLRVLRLAISELESGTT
jgi:hypothetical protein